MPKKSGHTIAFCLPGDRFPRLFTQSWIDLVQSFPQHHITPIIKTAHASNYYLSRNLCLDGQIPGAPSQTPFKGKSYNFILFLHPNAVFTPTNFYSLLDTILEHPHISILSALQYTKRLKTYTAIESWDFLDPEQYAKPNYLTPQQVNDQTKPIRVLSAGLSFTLIRQGVFETIPFPWFRQYLNDPTDSLQTLIGGPTSFALQAKKHGFSSYVDPQVVVGHHHQILTRPENAALLKPMVDQRLSASKQDRLS